MFIQVMRGRCTDPSALKKRLDLWEETLADGAAGWLGTTGGVTADGEFVGVVRFDSRASAEANAGRPEQDAWWRDTATTFDGEVSFDDHDDATTFLDGGSDDAGFVQVMQGRVADAGKFRAFLAEPMDDLRAMRPEIIGGTVAVADDGRFTQTIYFTSEAAAREGERQEMPDEVAAEMGEMSEVEYLDLTDPWFAGRA